MKVRTLVCILSAAFVGIGQLHAETLQEAVSTTITTNPDVLAAANERLAVAEEVNQAEAGYYPTIDFAIGTGWELTNSPSTRASGKGEVHLNRDEASIDLRQMLYDGMATKNEVRRQTARTNSRAYSVYSAAENTALEAVKAYLDVLRRQKLVDLASANLEAHERFDDQIRLRSERGVGRKADVDQSKGRMALATANLVAEQSNLRDSETSYLRVIGIAPESLMDPESPVVLLPGTLDEAIERAKSNHPTLKTAESDVESAYAQHDTAKSPFQPRIHFELGATSNHDIDGVPGTNKDITAMIRLRYNLLNGGRDEARREETAHLINQASEIRNNTLRQVEESTRLSWNALQTVNNQMGFFKQHVESSELSRDAYQQQFSLGQRTLLDLLDSENEVFVARTSYVNAQYDQLYAMYRILNSMGVLMESLGVAAPETSLVVSESE
jgi:adhesin transport system outer membrane protein